MKSTLGALSQKKFCQKGNNLLRNFQFNELNYFGTYDSPKEVK